MENRSLENRILHVDKLTKTFGFRKWFSKSASVAAVDQISFGLDRGEILGFLGTNGSGKTTTIQMLLDVLDPTSGSIFYFGKNLQEHREEVLSFVTHASAYTKLIHKLTVMENLVLTGTLYGIPRPELMDRITMLLKHFFMWNMRHRLARELSAGQTTRIVLARAFLPHPKIILLDEPTASLDPEIAHEVRRFILHKQREENVSILFTSHNMDEVAEICNRVLVLQRGKVIADDTPQNLAARIQTTRVWLMVNDPQDIERLVLHSQRQSIEYEITGQTIELKLSEHRVPELLHTLTHLGVNYSNISIEKPQLEDYFLHIAKRRS